MFVQRASLIIYPVNVMLLQILWEKLKYQAKLDKIKKLYFLFIYLFIYLFIIYLFIYLFILCVIFKCFYQSFWEARQDTKLCPRAVLRFFQNFL